MKAEDLIFFDIETVPAEPSLDRLDPHLAHLWQDKMLKLNLRTPGRYDSDIAIEDAYESDAGIFAEFGKIVCISAGIVVNRLGKRHFRIKSYFGDDEEKILKEFSVLLTEWGKNPEHSLCGHNIKEFDVPFVARRLIIHNMPLPQIVDVAGKKPWEIKFMDTLEMWKFGDYKHYTSLNLLAAVLGIPSPKDDIDGSQVAKVYYKEKDVQRIATYCEKDVLTTAQVFLRLRGEALLNTELIERVNG